MTKLIITGLFALFFSIACAGKRPKSAPFTAQKITVTHFNITFAPDLSNRVNPDLYKRPLNDVDILKIITANLYPSILRFRRSENQKDKLLVDFINKFLIKQYGVNTDKLLIDFGSFSRQNDRINYIMERDHVRQTLRQDAGKMVAEFDRINSEAARQNFGADIYTYFNEGIDKKNVLPAGKPFEDEANTYVNNFKNVLFLTTDGYIEAGIYDKGYDLSKNRIDAFRAAFLASGQSDLKTFFKKSLQFRINPVHNDNLKNLEVLVMELYDRSKSKTGRATVQPTDMEIMKLFWTDWLQQCGVKRFELHPCASSKDEAEKIILDFLGVNKIQ
jgi:hypothetical protein